MQRNVTRKRPRPEDAIRYAYLETLEMIPKHTGISILMQHFIDRSVDDFFSRLEAVLKRLQPRQITLEGWESVIAALQASSNPQYQAEVRTHITNVLHRIYCFPLLSPEIPLEINIKTSFLPPGWPAFFLNWCADVQEQMIARAPKPLPPVVTPRPAQAQPVPRLFAFHMDPQMKALAAHSPVQMQSSAPSPSPSADEVIPAARGVKRARSSSAQITASVIEPPAKKPRNESSVTRKPGIFDNLDTMPTPFVLPEEDFWQEIQASAIAPEEEAVSLFDFGLFQSQDSDLLDSFEFQAGLKR